MPKEGALELGHDFGGLGHDFGGTDYSVAQDLGYSHADIYGWAINNPTKFIGQNAPGNATGLYESILRGEADALVSARDRNEYNPSLYKEYMTRADGKSPLEIQHGHEITLQGMVGDSAATIANINAEATLGAATIAAGAVTGAETIKGEWQKALGEIQGKWSTSGINLQTEAAKYMSDNTISGNQEVEKLKGINSTALQNIINAGNLEVAAMRTKADISGIELQGQYSISGEHLRQEGAKELAKLEGERQLYGSLIGAFNFA